MSIHLICHLFFRCNFIKTVWFNFKMLPFSQARKLPIFIYRNVHFRDLSGKIIINNVKSGMVKIGRSYSYIATSVPITVWTIRGRIVFNGPTHFFHGTYVLVSDNGTLSFGEKWITIGTGSKIICFDNITIGNRVAITWECQIMDTSFHYIIENESSKASSLTNRIIIGDHVWVGNRTTISKGTVIPNESIVASNSLVNKDFTNAGSCCMIAGMPAKIVKHGVKRIWDSKEELELDKKFGYHRTLL